MGRSINGKFCDVVMFETKLPICCQLASNEVWRTSLWLWELMLISTRASVKYLLVYVQVWPSIDNGVANIAQISNPDNLLDLPLLLFHANAGRIKQRIVSNVILKKNMPFKEIFRDENFLTEFCLTF